MKTRQLRPLAWVTALAPLAACVQVPKAVDVGEVPDYFRRDEVAVMWEVCIPDKTVRLERVDADVSTDLHAFVKEYRERANSGHVVGVAPPATSVPGPLTAWRFVASSLPGQIDSSVASLTEVYNDDGARSVGFVIGNLEAITQADQPVYQSMTRIYRALVATNVRISKGGHTDDVYYWFQPPAVEQVPFGAFTAWQPAVSVETLQAFHLGSMVYERGPKAFRGTPVTEDSAHLPKIRYRLMTERDYWGRDRPWRVSSAAAPLSPTGQRGSTTPSQQGLYFADPGEFVPRCD